MNRVLPGIGLAVCWLLLLLNGSTVLFAVVLLPALAIGAYEYGRMTLVEDRFAQSVSLALLSVLPLVFQIFNPELGLDVGVVLAFLLLAFWTLATYQEGFDSYGFLARGTFGLIWIGFMGAHLYRIRCLPDGNVWLLILSGITAGSDSGAYYAGRAFGKHKLSSLISPKKTVEGAVGGILTGILFAGVLAFSLLNTVPWLFLVLIAIILGGIGICGDLTESVVKRATGTKDSGAILGGHGGILDRADSMLFAAPVLYYLLLIFFL
ncbi:MAG: phosphatidate cytidylyltransferase [Desulfocapsa sp.]|nr:MAG: phosphatidate cytidylyltransferase [Desulfocapsa sp.]